MRELREHALDSADQSKQRALLDTPQVFWVDDEDDALTVARSYAGACGIDLAPQLADGRLTVRSGEQRLDLSAADAGPHDTLLALDRTLKQSHRVRLVLASVGDDSLAFVALASAQWRQLDDDIGDALVQVVWRLDEELDPFVDLDDGDVLGAFAALLQHAPGYYGDCLSRALADPDSVNRDRHSGADDLLNW